jgi:hypothetical protein
MVKPSSSTSSDVPLQPLPSSNPRDGSSKPKSTSRTSGLETGAGPSRSRPQPRPSSPESPLSHLKARLSLLRPGHSDDVHRDGDSGSEDDLLLDPNLPTDHSQRHQAIPLHSLPTTDHDETKTSLELDSDRAPLVPGKDDSDSDSDADSSDANDEVDEVEDSPYPEVRAAVHPYDDPSLPCNTVRAWAIGLSLIFLGASMNTLFSLRSPNISLGALIAQVIAW